jgi:hypothetical protein
MRMRMLLALMFLGWLSACKPQEQSNPQAEMQREREDTEKLEMAIAANSAEIERSLVQVLEDELTSASAKNDALETLLRDYPEAGKRYEYLKPKLQARAEQEAHIQVIKGSFGTPSAKIFAIEALLRDYPQLGKQYKHLLAPLRKEAAQYKKETARYDQKQMCTDQDYSLYRQYDRALDASPSISAERLRQKYAYQFGISESELRSIHSRCFGRWQQQEPGEANAYRQQIYIELGKLNGR